MKDSVMQHSVHKKKDNVFVCTLKKQRADIPNVLQNSCNSCKNYERHEIPYRNLPCSFFRDNFLKQHLLCILCLAFIMLYKVSHRSFQQWKWRKKAKKGKSWGASKQSINLPTQKHLFNRKIFSLSKTLEEEAGFTHFSALKERQSRSIKLHLLGRRMRG